MSGPCIDQDARDAIRAVRDEAAANDGAIARELSELRAEIQHIGRFLGAPPYVRPHLNGNKPPSFADIVEEVTSPRTHPSNPVVSAIDRWTGKQVRRVIGAGLLLLGGAGLKWVWDLVWAAVHR